MNAFIEKWANMPPGRPARPVEPPETEPASLDNTEDSTPGKTDEVVTEPSPNMAQDERLTLKGQAVELWRDGRRFFLVADEQDAHEAMRRFGTHRGEVWTSGELELVASIPDQATRDEVESFKRQLDGCLSAGAAGKCISAAEWQTQMLNQMFKDQGILGEPGKARPETVRHGERGRK